MYFKNNTPGEVFTTVQFYYSVDAVFPEAVLHTEIHLIFCPGGIESQVFPHIRLTGNNLCHQIYAIHCFM